MTSLVQSRALETGEPIDYNNCTDVEEFITGLVAIYAVCYLTAGSALGARKRSSKKCESSKALTRIGKRSLAFIIAAIG
jgi:hypothetical protein